MKGLAVVTPTQMKRIEQKAFDAGESDEHYMWQAGEGIAHHLEEALITPRGECHVYLLIGKGNNGGDAFVVGEVLLKKGFAVTAYHLAPLEECSPLCKKRGHHFIKEGGHTVHLEHKPHFDEHGIIIDGLFGTGFKGSVEGVYYEVIEGANKSGLPIYSIDIPSGLNGETGEVSSITIDAYVTFFLGLPKTGFFKRDGWDHVGRLVGVDFGMPARFYDDLDPEGYMLSEAKASKALPKLKRSRHKYDAGYVLAVAGSREMPGAALMSSFAALKMGAGMVRLFHPEGMREELSSSPYEVIKEEWDLQNDARIYEEEKRAKALLIGPGMGRSDQAHRAVKNILKKTTLPTVIDADALYFLAKERGMSLPEKTLLTPHKREMERLLGEEPTLENCSRYAHDHQVTILLKGAVTTIFHPIAKPLIVPGGDPGMATAGSGDVLTGMLAALLAAGLEVRTAAALGAHLHALAGEIGAMGETSYGLVATDLISYLPEAIHTLQTRETFS